MTRAFLLAAGSLVLCTAACSSAREVLVDVHTDFSPGGEFDVVVLSTSAGRLSTPARSGDWLAGVRVGPVASMEGPETIVVSLERGGRSIARRTVRANVRGTIVLPVWLVRACADVTCPEAGGDALATECDLGRCVRPECIELGDEGCGEAECLAATDCAAPASDCARAACREGRCVSELAPGACPATAFCDPERGCTPYPLDAGPPDGGPAALDAGPLALDAGPTCPGATLCGTACVDVTSDEAHCGRCDQACGAGLRCSGGACVPAGCGAGLTLCEGECVSLADTHQSAGCGVCDASYLDCGATLGCETPAGTLTSCTSCSENCTAAHLTTCTPAGCAGPCEPGWAFCGAGPGCETPLGTLTHCTSCSENCAAAHLTTCTPAGCAGPCEPGWTDCSAGPGCETQLGTLTSCTSCSENCAAAHLTTCTAAGCAGPCEPGWAFCGAGPGCETQLGTLTSCTSCSENCAAAHLTTCTAAGCAGPCAPGWCDLGPGPGCETPC